MPGTAASSSPAIYETRQQADPFTIVQTPLVGLASVLSNIMLVKGHASIRILSRSDVAGTVEVYQAVTNPAGGPTFVQTKSVPATVDPNTGEFVTFFDEIVYGEFARVVYVNGAGAQVNFEMSAYGLPISAGSGSGTSTSGAEPCTKVFCYLTFA